MAKTSTPGRPVKRMASCMIQLTDIEDIGDAPGATGLRIPCSKDHSIDTSVYERCRTHDAGFEGHIERGAAQAIIAKMMRRITQRDDLSMRCWIATTDGTIRTATDHALSLHDNRTHGHLASARRRSRELDRLAHEFRIGDQRITCQRV